MFLEFKTGVHMDNLGNLPLFGLFLNQLPIAIPLSLIALLVIGYNGMPLIVWAVAGSVILAGFGAPIWLLGAFVAIMLVFLITPIRRVLISSGVMKLLAPIMPKISDTE